MKIPLDGPYRRKKPPQDWIFSWCLYIAIVAATILLVWHGARLVRSRCVTYGWEHSAVPKEVAVRVMKYHGPRERYEILGSKMTLIRDGNRVVVWRGK